MTERFVNSFSKTLNINESSLQVILWREDSPGRWNKLHEHCVHDSSVNSVSFAPHELGLILAAGSSDGSISILHYSDVSNQWETEKIPNAHTIGCNSVSWAPAQGSNPLKYLVTSLSKMS